MAATLINFPHVNPSFIWDSSRRTNHFSENNLVDEFFSLKPYDTFKCINGESLLIIDKGKLNPYDGPDIIGCEIFIDGIFLKGNAECHLHVNDWYHHKHQNDPLYNDVILHIIKFHPDGNRMPDIPTLVLNNFESKKGVLGQCNYHQNLNLNVDRLGPLIQKRWIKMVNRFYVSIISEIDLNEIIFLELVRHLCGKGNRRNGIIFSKKFIENLNKNITLESAFDYALNYSQKFHWNSKGVRPYKRLNHLIPQLKCVVIIVFKNKVNTFYDLSDLIEKIKSSLSKVCGQGSLVEILGNVMYPFGAAMSISRSKFEESEKYFKNWKQLSLPYTYGAIERKFNPYFSRKYLKKFHILQGLIELERMYCQNQFCNICPFCG